MRRTWSDLVRGDRRTPGVRSLSMTTNGVLLGKLAEPLERGRLAAGQRQPRYAGPRANSSRLTRWGSLDQVWEGIEAAERAGLTPVKLNAVVVRGYNEADVVDLAALTLDHPWQVRFIEMMPFAGAPSSSRRRWSRPAR